MTLFSSLLKMAGLSIGEASNYFETRPDTMKSWSAGRNPVPDGILDKLHTLMERQEAAASAAFDVWMEQGQPDELEIGIASDNYEAQQLGWPCVGAQMATIARLWEMVHGDAVIKLVPRGSTVPTAIAIEAHNK